MSMLMTKSERRAEIRRLQEAINKSKSLYLKRDYTKRIERLKKNK